MMSFLYELKRTVATMALFPWMVVRSPSPSSLVPAPTRMEGESLRWVVIQILVLYAFYRLMTPLLSSRKSGYSRARVLMDAWLFSALAIHTPALSATLNPRPTRLFASVFALFLVASHVTLAFFTLSWHVIGWLARTFWPNIVDVLWLPSGQRWKSPSMGNLIRFSLILSLFTSLVFVGCTIEAQQSSQGEDVPMICRGGWYTKTSVDEDGMTIYHRMGYLKYLGQLSLLDSPVGLLWLSGLALFVIYYVTRRSSRLSLRARLKAAMRLEDVFSRADALFQTEVEDGYTTEPSTTPSKTKETPQFLDMCEWYSVATVDTAVQLLISLKLFFGRFDLRLLKRPEFGMYAKVETKPPPPVFGEPFSTTSLSSVTSSPFKRNFRGGGSSLTRFAVDENSASQATLSSAASTTTTTLDEETDLYFDWMADTGDGGHSTYQVARWLAKPVLYVRMDMKSLRLMEKTKTLVPKKNGKEFGDLVLPRGKILLIGGDLAYPDPSIENLDRRLFQPFCDAMEPPPSYRKEHVSVLKREGDAAQQKERETIRINASTAPVCYCLAGNHDHFDGLHAFYRCIIDRDWLGGWRLPQTSSYFSIKLTHGWWIFALDQALGEDIDSTQFRYFEHLATHVLEKDDRIIVASHEPIWLYDAYCERPEASMDGYKTRAPLVKELVWKRLRGKIGLRLCGDLHNYMRYEERIPGSTTEPLNLVISGGGGAFLHPTHPFPEELKEDDKTYARVACYPDEKTSRRLGFENLGSGFRLHNWRFDFVGASVYFLICVSLFPRCGVKDRVVDASTNGVYSYIENFSLELVDMVGDSFRDGVISPLVMILVMIITVLFADGEKGFAFQLRLGVAHGMAHIFFALTAFMLFQITVEIAIVDKLAGSSFYSLFESFLETERGAVPQSAWTDATFLNVIREILRGFDMPESVAVPHAIWCRNPQGYNIPNVAPNPDEALSRFDVIWFYIASYSYFYVLSADLVALVIGIYLAVSASVFFVHWNESFSSLRHRHLKNFIRFKVDKQTGDLHAFVLGIDRVPVDWMLNPNYETTAQRMKRFKVDDELDPRVASFGSSTPSKWLPRKRRDVLQSKARLVDYFVVRNKRTNVVN